MKSLYEIMFAVLRQDNNLILLRLFYMKSLLINSVFINKSTRK